MNRRARSLAPCICLIVLTACIRPQNYHPSQSVFNYAYSSTDKRYGKGYFLDAKATEMYVEFDARGYMYRDEQNQAAQLREAVKAIQKLRHPKAGVDQKVVLAVFVHGWKNDASENSGNVWGFRRILSHIAWNVKQTEPDVPVAGLYIGWPGASTNVGTFFSFWNREPIADAVGAGELTEALKEILKATKDNDYKGKSTAVVVGHSFGGLVLERAAIALLREQIQQLDTDPEARSPANLFVIINEAGASALARPFLLELAKEKVAYSDASGKPHPLMISMTSTGDAATKLAYPGGEWFSFNRPATQTFKKLDEFGQSSTLPYNLLTAANMVALQSHDIAVQTPSLPCDLTIGPVDRQTYCMNAKKSGDRLNNTPYWIMQLPQIFVPDHSSVFRDEVISLLGALLSDADLIRKAVPSAPPNASSTPRLGKSK